MIAAAGPAGTVYVRADSGSYPFTDSRIAINQGGQVGSTVTIMGVNQALAPMKAIVVGSRTAWTLPTDPEAVTNVNNWTTGSGVFFLRSGADYLTFKFFDFQRVSAPFHLIAPTHKGITVSDCSAYNVVRFFEHDPGTSHIDTVLKNVTVIGFSKSAVRIRGDSHNLLLEDINLNSGRQDGDNFATGVECNETAHDIIMRRVTVTNCHDTRGSNPDKFWNADGFASERGNYNIRREHCTSSGNTDAGYDDKGTNVTNLNCIASGNKVNYKFWGPSTTNINCQALDPKSRGGTGAQMQYYTYGNESPAVPGAEVLIQGGVISDNDSNTHVFVAEAYNNLFRIIGPTITKHADAVMETEVEGWGNGFLYGSASDASRPTITSPAILDSAINVNFAHLLRANKPVTWSIIGGSDAASFKVLAGRSAGTLTLAAAVSGGANRQVIVRATDVNGNEADQAITLAFGGTGAIFFRDQFDRPDQDLGASGDWRFVPESGADGGPGDIAIRHQKLAIFNAASRGVAYASPACGFVDHYVQARVASIPNYYNGILACRFKDPRNFVGVEFKNDRISLYERLSGRFAELASIASPPSIGDVIRLEVKGADATVVKNGVVVIGPKATAVTNPGWTRSGLVSRSFAVNPWIDDYETGPV
jgi:hypothetical protein